MKNNGLVNYVYKIYSLTIKNKPKEVSFTQNDGMIMDTRMNDYAKNII